MRSFAITLMNYRCFSGNGPTTWRFTGEGLTSFVGPNNAGKSTFLRLFFELRTVFATLAEETNLRAYVLNPNFGLAFAGTSDNTAEIVAYRSTGPVVIEFSIDVADPHQLSRVRLQLQDRKAQAWAAQIFSGPDFSQVNVQDGEYPPVVAGINGRLETAEFSACMKTLSEGVTYIPAYRNLINQGSGTYYDVLVGQGFVQMWDQWQGGDSKDNREAIIDVIADIKRVFGFSELGVAATPQKDTLTLVVDGRPERIRELGAGLSQFIIVLGNVATKRPEILVIDEPELNLHPAMQLKFLAALGPTFCSCRCS